ncbi:MAG: hypothetical protein Q9222_003949 [Ikaeria aurantiellina]
MHLATEPRETLIYSFLSEQLDQPGLVLKFPNKKLRGRAHTNLANRSFAFNGRKEVKLETSTQLHRTQNVLFTIEVGTTSIPKLLEVIAQSLPSHGHYPTYELYQHPSPPEGGALRIGAAALPFWLRKDISLKPQSTTGGAWSWYLVAECSDKCQNCPLQIEETMPSVKEESYQRANETEGRALNKGTTKNQAKQSQEFTNNATSVSQASKPKNKKKTRIPKSQKNQRAPRQESIPGAYCCASHAAEHHDHASGCTVGSTKSTTKHPSRT